MRAKCKNSVLAILLTVAATAMPVLGETINMDFGRTNTVQESGWNRMWLDSDRWGIGHSYTPWTNNLINSEGELTNVRLQVLQRATTWRVNTYPSGLAGDAKKLFGAVAAGTAANDYNETSDCKLAFLGLDTNKFYKITVFCSKSPATGVATNGFYLNKGRTTTPPLETSVLNMLPYNNNSVVYWHTNQPYYVKSYYAGALGNISTTVLKFDFLRVGTVGVGALNGLIIESLPPPPPRVTVLVVR